MSPVIGERNRGKTFMGLTLVGLGILFLLGTLGLVDMQIVWWQWWPAVLIIIGLSQVISPTSIKQGASGVSLIMLGLWFFACFNHWYGLRFRNAWPLVLVIFGIESIVIALFERGRKGVQQS